MFRFVTVGMLPRRLREQYGLPWDGRRKLVLRAGTTATRTMLTMVPPPIRHAPIDVLQLGRVSSENCSRCGAPSDCEGSLPAGWSLVTDERGVGLLCLECTRANVRSIEAKLPEEWWE